MTIYILGAGDPEMERIEALLTACGRAVVHAIAGERRVHPGSAYAADSADGPLPLNRPWVMIECGWAPAAAPAEKADITVIDHHRPGDPGFGRPPAEFLAASSLGQVISNLSHTRPALISAWPGQRRASVGVPPDWRGLDVGEFVLDEHSGRWYVGIRVDTQWDAAAIEIPQDLVLAAAADHCLGAAYQGWCPGVHPVSLMTWRAESRAKFQRRTAIAVLADVEAAIAVLRVAPKRHLCGGLEVATITGSVPELPEAGTRSGISYEADGLIGPDKRRKIVLSSVDPALVRAWIVEQQSLGRETYGDPERGFAGAYLDY